MASRQATAITLFLASLCSGLASARPFVPPPMPEGYNDPGPKPANPLPEIISKLRGTLKDPFSLRGFIMCEPFATQPDPPAWKEASWNPAEWMVIFAYFAKNSYGAYEGQQDGHAWFRNGSLRLDLNQEDTSTPIGAMIQGKLNVMLSHCQHIPDDQIQKLVQNTP